MVTYHGRKRCMNRGLEGVCRSAAHEMAVVAVYRCTFRVPGFLPRLMEILEMEVLTCRVGPKGYAATHAYPGMNLPPAVCLNPNSYGSYFGPSFPILRLCLRGSYLITRSAGTITLVTSSDQANRYPRLLAECTTIINSYRLGNNIINRPGPAWVMGANHHRSQ